MKKKSLNSTITCNIMQWSIYAFPLHWVTLYLTLICLPFISTYSILMFIFWNIFSNSKPYLSMVMENDLIKTMEAVAATRPRGFQFPKEFLTLLIVIMRSTLLWNPKVWIMNFSLLWYTVAKSMRNSTICVCVFFFFAQKTLL